MKKITRNHFLKFLLATGTLTLTSCTPPNSKIPTNTQYFRYAENQPEGYPTTAAAEFFAELVAQRTNGRLNIIVYANSELGDETSTIEQTQLGMIDFVRVGLATLSEFVPALNVLQMPFLYTDSAHMWRVLDGEIGREMRATLDMYSLYGLSWFDAGARSFYTCDEPITCFSDLAGKTIRVQESTLMQDLITELGGIPVTVFYDEVYASLQSGTIDGAENNYPSYESMKHYEVAPFFFNDEHIRVPELQLCSQHFIDSLSPEDCEVILAAATESAFHERTLWTAREEKSKQAMLDHGVQIYELSAIERTLFIEASKPLYEKYCKNNLDLIQRIQKI